MMETYVIKKRMLRLLASALTMSFVLTGFTIMPAVSQIVDPDSDNGVVYAAAKKVKVTYKANGGNFTAKKHAKKKSYSKKLKKYKKHGNLPKVVRKDYALKGWYTKKSAGKKVTAKTVIKKKTTLYAHWAKKYKLNTKYYKHIEERKTIEEWEKIYGKLTYYKLFGDECRIYKSTSGIRVWFWKYLNNSNEYQLAGIESNVKTIVKSYSKKTKYKDFLLKLGVKKYGIEPVLSDTEDTDIYFTKSKMVWKVNRLVNKKNVYTNDYVGIFSLNLME